MLKGRVSTIDEEFEKGEAPKLTKEESAEWLNMKIMNRAKDCLRYPDKDKKPNIDCVTNKIYNGLVEDWGYNETVLNAMRAVKADRAYVMNVIEVLFDEDGDPIVDEKTVDGGELKEVAQNPTVYNPTIYSDDPRAMPYYTASLTTIGEEYDGLKKAGAYDPAAVAASIGRKKYGKEKFQQMAAAGRKRKAKGKKVKDKMKLGGGGRFAKLEEKIAEK